MPPGVEKEPVAKLPQMAAAVTNVAFAPQIKRGQEGGGPSSSSSRDMLAIGMEDGQLELWAIAGPNHGARSPPSCFLPMSACHISKLLRLCIPLLS